MSTLTTKKQNRVLYITLAVLLAAAALLLILTGNANKKETEELPESGNQVTESVKPEKEKTGMESDREDAGIFGNKQETESSAPETNTPETKKTEDTKASAADTPETTTTSALPKTLPVFSSPIAGGTILRGHSVDIPVFSPTMEDYRTHTGLDILCETNAAVLAAADGKIGNFWNDPLMGYTLSVIHGGDAVTIYQGLTDTLPEGIEPGAAVKAGQTIACVGDTALIECEDEPHLHFELTIDGVSADPAEYFALPTMAEVYEN